MIPSNVSRVNVFACAAVIFDLDGVLADSTQAVDKSWEVWSKRRGIDPRRAIAAGHGRTTIETVRELAPDEDANEGFAEMEALEASFLNTVVPLPGAPEFVARVNRIGVPWAVATSGTRRIAIPRLHRCGIESPPVLVTADDITRGKPDPQPYVMAAERLGIPARDCIVFEDAPSGMRSARSAGARVISVGILEPALADGAVRDFRSVEILALAQPDSGRPHVVRILGQLGN